MTPEEESVWRFEQAPRLVSMEELITIILGGNTFQTAKEIVERYGTPENRDFEKGAILGRAEYHDLMSIKGMTKQKALKLCAAIELGNRLAEKKAGNPVQLSNAERVWLYFSPKIRYETQEHFMVAYVNVKNRLLGYRIISKGNLNAAPVDIKEVMRWGMRYKAYGLILVHNHPSGDPEPSEDDIRLTEDLKKAAMLLDFVVLDHVIIGDGKYVSFHERNLI